MFVYEFLMSTQKTIEFLFENAIIPLIITIGAIIVLVRKVKFKKRKSSIKKYIQEEYWEDKLFHDLWWDTVHEPFIGFEGDAVEPIQIHTLEEYKKDYMIESNVIWFSGPGLKVDYIIDAMGQRYLIDKISLADLWVENQDMADIAFEKTQKITDIVPFDLLKKQILDWIKDLWKSSVYSWLEEEIQKSHNIIELVKVMDKGFY